MTKLVPGWLLLAVLSLAGGAMALVGLINLFYLPDGPDASLTPQVWRAHELQAESGEGNPSDKGLQLRLDDKGRAVVAVPAASLDADHYPFLNIRTHDLPADLSLTLLWRKNDKADRTLGWQIPYSPRQSLWISMAPGCPTLPTSSTAHRCSGMRAGAGRRG